MKRRSNHHDYQERRMYMITMEVSNRQPLLGRLTGELTAERGSSEEPRIVLTELGSAVEREWFGIPRYYPQIEVMGLQIMPDHLHGILFVHEDIPKHLSHVITGFKTGCNRAKKRIEGRLATEPQSTHNIMPPDSQRIAAPLQQSSVPFQPLFAPGYNDLILRNYEEFQRWKNYLADNPRRLMMKRNNPEWLRPFFHYQKGSYVYNGVGNRNLLLASHRLSVRISRRLTDEQLKSEVERYLSAARAGAVLISPAISKGEKMVMRQAFNNRLPTIVIMENGFTPLSKPHGEQFYACAEGRLLMLSAWDHHNEKKPLTAYMCQQMNLMALELSKL